MPTLLRRKENKPKVRTNDPYRHIYQSARWHKFSKDYLKKNRLCVECLKEGRTQISQCTDHIIPIKEGGEIWDEKSMQALCFRHHNSKTARENAGWNKK